MDDNFSDDGKLKVKQIGLNENNLNKRFKENDLKKKYGKKIACFTNQLEFIPFNIENLIYFKKFLDNENEYFFEKDLKCFFSNFSYIITNNFLNEGEIDNNEFKKSIQSKIYSLIVDIEIDKFLRIFLNSFFISKRKRNLNKNEFLKFINNLDDPEQRDFNLCSKEEISLDEKNIYIKKAPYKNFLSIVDKIDFLKDAKILEPVLITILNFFYYMIYFSLNLIKSPILSSIHPKLLKKKLFNFDKTFEKYEFSKQKIYRNLEENKKDNMEEEMKLFFDFIYYPNFLNENTDNQNFQEKLKNTILNVINFLLNFIQKIPKTSKKLIKSSQGILEILVNLLVYKNYLNHEKFERIKIEKNNIKAVNHLINFERKFSTKLISILNQFDKVLIFKTIIMLMDLNKMNNHFTKIISKFNSIIALKSFNNMMCLFNVFDLSNINLETTTKLVKKLFCSIPKFMIKKDYFKIVIDCFFDLIVILKNRDADEKLSGLKDFTINVFNEIILSFVDDLEFSRYLFYKFFNRFFRLFGYGINSCYKKVDVLSSNTQRINHNKNKNNKNHYNKIINHDYFFQIFPRNKDNFLIEIKSNMISYMDFLVKTFDFIIKTKFQTLFEFYENRLLFQALIEIISIFNKNRLIEELDKELTTTEKNSKIVENDGSQNQHNSEKDFIKTIYQICSLILENFETTYLAELFFNYYNSELLENVFDINLYTKNQENNNRRRIKNKIINYEFINHSEKNNSKIKESKIILKVNILESLYKNLLYYANYEATSVYIQIIENVFEIENFKTQAFMNSLLEILSQKNFFEKRNFSFSDILNEEKVILFYSQNNQFETKVNDNKMHQEKNKLLKLDLLKMDYSNNTAITEEETLDLIYKVNNFYLIIKNKFLQTFSKNIIASSEFLMENQEQAFKFILMILMNIPETDELNSPKPYDNKKFNFHNDNINIILDEEIVELVINCLGFILIDLFNSQNEKQESKSKSSFISRNRQFKEETEKKASLNCNEKLKNLLFGNLEKLISKLNILSINFPICNDIIEKLKILCIQKKVEEKNFLIKDSSVDNIENINVNKNRNSKQQKDLKILLDLLEKVEGEMKEIFTIENNNSNFEKSFILYRTYNLMNKEISLLKSGKMSMENPSLEILEKIKILFDIYIGFLKNIDEYLWKITQKNILMLFEMLFFFEDRKIFELFFNLINSTIKNIKNLGNENEFIKHYKNEKLISNLKDKEFSKNNIDIYKRKETEINLINTSSSSSDENIKEEKNHKFNKKMKLRNEISEYEKKLLKKQMELNFESQYFLKLIELIELIIKKNKSAVVLFYKQIFKLIFEVFDENFYIYDAIIISSLFSIIGTIISYCGLEINLELSVLIKTCINVLRNFKENTQIRRACANLLFKILTNCNFLHYQNFANEIYALININIDNRYENDKIVLFFMDKSIKFIKESVYDFYTNKIELALFNNKLITNIDENQD